MKTTQQKVIIKLSHILLMDFETLEKKKNIFKAKNSLAMSILGNFTYQFISANSVRKSLF